MSVFTRVPAGFPLDPDFSQRPVDYVLQLDASDRFAIVLLSVIWIAAGPVAAYIVADLLFGGGVWITAALSLAYLLWAIFFHFGPEIVAAYRAVHITITETDVTVSESGPTGVRSWSAPLTAFEGTAVFDMGTHHVDVRKVPVSSVVLKHPEPERSVPLTIREARLLGKRTAKKKAAQLGVPVLDGTVELAGGALLTPDVLLVNRFQAMKVRLFYWGLNLVGVAVIALSLYAAVTGAFEAAYGFLLVFAPTVMAAMHVYTTCYVTAMRERDGKVEVTTASGGRRLIDRQAVRGVTAKSGRLNTIKHRVNAPWLNLRVEGRFLPFIIDMQADYVNEKRIEALVRG